MTQNDMKCHFKSFLEDENFLRGRWQIYCRTLQSFGKPPSPLIDDVFYEWPLMITVYNISYLCEMLARLNLIFQMI